MTWLSEIEKDIKQRLNSCVGVKQAREKQRMARVLRELAGYAQALEKHAHATAITNAREQNLSDDAKELCVAANESSRERTDAGENNATK